MTTWLDKHEICALLKVTDRTLTRYRSDKWMIGIHYVKPVQKILYNKELIEDWLVNRHEWHIHLRAIDLYQASLPSNQKRRKSA
jgi:hypothetical protein